MPENKGSRAGMIYQTEETLLRILQTAEQCFCDKGFFETQMKDIAAAVGMSRNTLYRYFRDKTDLGLSILELILVRQLGVVNAELKTVLRNKSTPARARLHSVLSNSMLNTSGSIDEHFIAEFDAYFSDSRIPANFQQRVKESMSENTLELFIRLLRQGCADGSIRVDIDPNALAVTIVNAIRALQQRVILRRNSLLEVTAEGAEEMPELLLTIIIDGIKPLED